MLLSFSLVFYAWGEQKMVLLLILSSVVDFISGILIDKKFRKLGLLFSLTFNLGILCYFKYVNFFIDTINSVLTQFSVSINNLYVIMPLGISFFTFQTMSYSIDVYKGKIKATYNFIDFCTYVCMFPQLVAGPIVRFEEIQYQLKNKKLSVGDFNYGAKRFVSGLFKKLFIANNLALISDVAFENPQGYGTLLNWMGIIAYTLTIYYDFSGYSDMAIGLGKIFGFDFPENFNYPYLSKSIREFWRRWHMTMSNWFRDYLYIPLGGNRNKNTIRNLIVVFIATGLWHGASWNFIIWGVIHGFFIVLERYKIIQLKSIFGNLYTLLVVAFSFVFFKTANLKAAVLYLKGLFVFKPMYDSNVLSFIFRGEVIIAIILSLVFVFPVSKKIREILNKYSFMENTLYLLMFFVSLVYVAVGAYNPFIYFRF
ncbi:MBOAT family O-acyltransferase [Wenyingzhuangia sp. IMCC45574]